MEEDAFLCYVRQRADANAAACNQHNPHAQVTFKLMNKGLLVNSGRL